MGPANQRTAWSPQWKGEIGNVVASGLASRLKVGRHVMRADLRQFELAW